MEKTAFELYVLERYQKQMDYYKFSSSKNQKRYKQFQFILIVLSALTPVLAALSGLQNVVKIAPINILVVLVSSIVAILTTSLKTFNYQELWVKYRTTYEKLKPEIHYYNFNVGQYGVEGVDKESVFVTRVEAILDAEHAAWPPIIGGNEKK